MTQNLTREQLQEHIDRFPRMQIAHLPTPLEEMPRLTKKLGGPNIWIKREDMTGLAYGGNKARHYEFEMPHSADQGYDVMINIMDYHSNNARMTGAAANKIGMRYILILKNAANRIVQGNLLVDKILGAELHLLDEFQSNDAEGYAANLKEQLEEQGHKPYLIQDHLFPRIVGMIGFLETGLELEKQFESTGIDGSVRLWGLTGRSIAGLRLYAKNRGLNWQATAVQYSPGKIEDFHKITSRRSSEVAKMFDLKYSLDESDITVLENYRGPAYGEPDEEVINAIRLVGKAEGLILDPNYTGKAMSGLIGELRTDQIDLNETICFIHSGGLPQLFAHADKFTE